jgi:hypothetical protein
MAGVGLGVLIGLGILGAMAAVYGALWLLMLLADWIEGTSAWRKEDKK